MSNPQIKPKWKEDGGLQLHAKAPQEFTADYFTPEFQAALTEGLTSDKGIRHDIAVKQLRQEITEACDEVNAGSMRLPEQMALTQAQSARTLETHAALKSPTIFAKQSNVANQQVVTNGTAAAAPVSSAPEVLREPAPIVPFEKSHSPAPAHERLDR